MKTITINLATYKNRAPVTLGLQGENAVRQIDFDYSSWAELYGEGTVTLAVQRNGDSNPYPLTLTSADHIASWNVSTTDTEKKGKGEAQLSYTVNGAIKKSEVISFIVKRSLDSEGDVPDPYISWFEQMIETGQQVAQYAESASSSAQESYGYSQDAKEYARTAKQAVTETLQFADDGDGEIVISFNTEV